MDLWQMNVCVFCKKEFLAKYKSKANVCSLRKCKKEIEKYNNGTY
jgi:hypothetical protein